MPVILPVEGVMPQIKESCFVAPNATIVGDVTMGEHCSFWFNCVVRGDVNKIILGEAVNIQDGAVIHCTYQKTETIIGNYVSVGHNAIVHGCQVEDHCLIGMGAIVMDNAVVGHHSIVAAGAVVLEGTIIPPYSVYAGVPAKKVKELNQNLNDEYIKRISENYIKYSQWFKQ